MKVLLLGGRVVGPLLFGQAVKPLRAFASPRVCSGGQRKLCEARNAL